MEGQPGDDSTKAVFVLFVLNQISCYGDQDDYFHTQKNRRELHRDLL